MTAATTRAELQRAKDADLVTFGPGVTGTKCGNCQFLTKYQGAHCIHPKVNQPIPEPEKMCCIYWDRPGTKRAWEKR